MPLGAVQCPLMKSFYFYYSGVKTNNLQFLQNIFDFFELDSQELLPSVPSYILKATTTVTAIKMLRREREKIISLALCSVNNILCVSHSGKEKNFSLSLSSKHFYDIVC